MRRFILTIIAAVTFLALSGCGNLSPRADPKLDQKIDNQNGKIGQIESIQNGMKNEIGKLQNQAEIQNSKLDRVQQGLLNVQSNNSGIMIFSGPGGLMAGIMIFMALGAGVIYYRRHAQIQEKTADILAEKLVMLNSPEVEDAVFTAAMHTNVAENMLSLIKNKKKSLM